MKQMLCAFLILVSLSFLPSLSDAANFEVSPDGSADCVGNPPCLFDLALAIAAQSPEDDTIEMDPGTYDPLFQGFLYQPIIAAGSLTILANGAILDGGKHQDQFGNTVGNQGLIIIHDPIIDDSSATVTIDGVTFQNNVNIQNDGAGLSVNVNSAPVNVLHCNFLGNFNEHSSGGGLAVISPNFSAINVAYNRFDKNMAAQGGGAAFLGTELGSISLVGNSFTDNSSSDIGSGNGEGGAVLAESEEGDLTVIRNFFSGNVNNDGFGGGIFGEAEVGSLIVTDNIFHDNQAFSPNSNPFQGGAGAYFEVDFAAATIINNTFVGNKATNGDGAGLVVVLGEDVDSLDLDNNIFWNNLVSGSSCAEACNDALIADDRDTNNVGALVNVFNNDFSGIDFQCDSGGGCDPSQNVDANIDEDPMFVNAAGDFNLLAGSPAIDAGTAAAPNLPATDFAGKARNQGAAPDMGALEFTPPHVVPTPPPEDCADNIDNDGDTKIDCNDSECSGTSACNPPPPPPGTENCGNDVDDDGDTMIDCADPDCSGAFSCLDSGDNGGGTAEDCANGADDDGDGQMDCSDGDCSGAAACLGSGGGDGQGSNVTVNSSGCSLAPGARGASSPLWPLAPILLALGGIAAKARRSEEGL